MADGENQTYTSIAEAAEGLRKQREAAAKAPAPEPKEQPAPAPVAEQEDEIDVADPATETLEGEADEPSPESDEAEGEEPDSPAIQAPQFWGAEERELFAKLPREAQEAVLKVEQQRAAFVSRKANEAAQAQRAAEAVHKQLSQHTEKLASFVSEVDAGIDYYSGIDWALEIAEATTPEDLANVREHQLRFEKLKQQRQEAENAMTQAQSAELQQFHQAQRQKLKAIAPDLDPDKPEGIQRVRQLSRFLEANGIDAQTQAWMPAEGMALAYDAARYRQLMAGKQAQPAAQPPKPPAGPTVRPASSSPGSSTTQRLSQLASKKSLSLEEAKEVMALKRKSKR